MSGSVDAGRLLVRIEATTAQLRQELAAAERQVSGTAGKIDGSLKQADAAFGRLDKASQAAQQSVSGLTGKLGPLGAGLSSMGGAGVAAAAGLAALGVGLGAIAKAGDAATATMARLNSATGGLGQAEAVYARLFQLSQQTGIAITESAGAFTRFSVAAKEIGGTNEQVLQLVSAVQKFGIVAGSSAQETASATQQLAQALASGTLQGDELRSILENMPQLAQALAREFGVGVGELRKMGEEGKLSADRVFPALLKAAEGINAEFEKMPPTMGRAFAILGESMFDFAANLDKALGLSQAIAQAALAAAGAVRGLSGAVAPGTPAEQAQAAVTTAQRNRDRLVAQAAAERAASAYGDTTPGMREAMDIAEGELRDALQRQQGVLRDDRETRRAEQDAAQGQAAESRRRASDQGLRDLRGQFDKEWKIREDSRKQREALEKAEASGAVSAEEAGRLRVAIAKDEKEALDKLTDSHKAVGAAAKDADEHVQAFYKAQEKAAVEAAKEVEKAAEEQQKYHERSWDQFASIGERAADRVGDALVQAFVAGEGSAVNFGNIMRGVAASVVADFAKLALINPLLNSAFTSSSGPRPTLAAAFGGGGAGVGAGDILGLSQMFGGKSMFESIGLTGPSGLLSKSLIDPGLVGGAIPGAPIGGLSVGGLLGGAGMGAGVGGLLANLTGGNTMGGSIGGGIGGAGAAALAAIPAVAGFLGPLAPFAPILGGLLGGGLGGLVGPGESVKGYGYQLTPANDGLLQMSSQFYNASGDAAFKEATAGIAQLNQYLGARGLNVRGAVAVGGNKDGADYSHATAGTFSEGLSQLYYGSSNAQLDFAMADQRGRKFGSTGELQTFVEGFYSAQDAIKAVTTEAVPPFIASLNATNDNFNAVAASAREYGLAVDEVTTAQAKAVAELWAARDETLRQAETNLDIRRMTAAGDTQGAELARQAEAARQEVTSFGKALDSLGLTAAEKAQRLVALEEVQAAERAAIITRFGAQASAALSAALNPGTGLLRELTYGGGSALAPSARYFAAMTDLNTAKQALDAGGSLSAYTQVASAVLPVARDFLGTSTRYAGLAAEVGQVLQANGGDGSLAALLSAQANTGDAQLNLTADIGSRTISELVGIRQAFERLATSVDAIITRKTA